MIPHDASWGDPSQLAALYAAGALPDAERSALEAHLAASCAACAAEVDQYGPALAALTASVAPATPNPGVREALLQRIATGSEPASGASPLRAQALAETDASKTSRENIIHTPQDGPWEDTAVPGVRLRVLHVDRLRNQFTALVRMAPGASYPRHSHSGPEQCLVLEGDLHVGDSIMRAGDYEHAEPGSAHGVQRTENGCLLFITSSLSDEFG